MQIVYLPVRLFVDLSILLRRAVGVISVSSVIPLDFLVGVEYISSGVFLITRSISTLIESGSLNCSSMAANFVVHFLAKKKKIKLFFEKHLNSHTYLADNLSFIFMSFVGFCAAVGFFTME